MPNPYMNLPAANFWKAAVVDIPARDLFMIAAKRFRIAENEKIATAGSCFAQELGKYLAQQKGITLLVEEVVDEGQPLFSARYGNIYTVQQLVQLFDRAFGAFEPVDVAWKRVDGRYIDPFRPYMFNEGLEEQDEVIRARNHHLQAVRNVFTNCTIFVFTLGLTEGWRAKTDGAVLPVAPGVVTDSIDPEDYEFHNFGIEEVRTGLAGFIERMRGVNPTARIILTVSPVPLIATYTKQHVLVATTYSKSVLRAVCGETELNFEHVYYFPSFEVISGSYSKGAYYNENMRTVTKEGVAHVMETFGRTYLYAGFGNEMTKAEPLNSPLRPTSVEAVVDDMPICDEEEIVRSIGFG